MSRTADLEKQIADLKKQLAEQGTQPKRLGPPPRAGATATVHIGYRATQAEAEPVLADARRKNETVSEWIRDAVKQKLARLARGAR